MQTIPMSSSVGRRSVSVATSPQPKCSFLSNVQSEEKESTTIMRPEQYDDSEGIPSDDTVSEDSLLDSCADEESSLDSEYVGCDRIVKFLERREKLLGRIAEGKSQFYEKRPKGHEMAKTLRCIRQSPQASSSNGERAMSESLSPSSIDFENEHRESSMMDFNNLSWSLHKLILLFEGRHSLEAGWVLCWYCIGHFGLICISEVLVERALRKSRLNPPIFYTLLILSALCTMRANGYLWVWLASDAYRRVKFDMHNRRVLRYWDARLLALLRRPSLAYFNRVISMSTFYILFHGCAFFYNVIIDSMKRVFIAMTDASTASGSSFLPNKEILNIDAQVDTSHPWISFSFLLLYIGVIVLATAATARVGSTVFTL